MGNFFVENVVSQHCFYVAQLQLLFQSTNRTAEFASLWCKCTRVLMKPEDRASVSTSVTGAEFLKTSADWSSLDSKSIKCIWLQFFRFITPILFVLVCMNHLCVTHWKTLFRHVCAVWMDPTVCLILFIPPPTFVCDLYTIYLIHKLTWMLLSPSGVHFPVRLILSVAASLISSFSFNNVTFYFLWHRSHPANV